MYSSLGRRVGYKKHSFLDVDRLLDKGLKLSRRTKSWEGEAGVALEGGSVLEEWEPEVAMPSK